MLTSIATEFEKTCWSPNDGQSIVASLTGGHWPNPEEAPISLDLFILCKRAAVTA